MTQIGGTSRPYASAKREAKAAETRARLLAAAEDLLRQPGGAALSLDAVAASAGVTRLTVYNQFGSRRGLMEAMLDAVATAGGLTAVAEAMAMPDPRAALARIVEAFCGFWSSNAGLTGIYAAAGADPELQQSLTARNARRRELMAVLVARQGGREPAAQRDVADLLFSLTGFPMFQSLCVDGREPEAVAALLAALCDRVLVEGA